MSDQERAPSGDAARCLFAAGLAAATFSLARAAAAQELSPLEPPKPPASIQAPQLKSDPGAAYPEQALRERFVETVTVPLVLDIDANGAVVGATVETPQGHGFDEAAQLAAARLVFEPALRDGKPTPARIRFRYVFVPPAPRLNGRVLGQTTDAPIAGATVIATDAADATHSTTTAADGSWSLAGLPP